MVFLKYVGVFVGVYLLFTFVTAFFIGLYSGAIGFIAAIVAVIYYRGRRRIRAAEDEFVEEFTDAYVAESRKRLDSANRQTTAKPIMTKAKRLEINRDEPKSTPASPSTAKPTMTKAQRLGITRNESESMRTRTYTEAKKKRDLLEFLTKIDRQGFEYATNVLGIEFLNLRPNQASLLRSGSLKSIFIETITRGGNVDQERIISSFNKDDLSRALNSIPNGQLTEIVALVNTVLRRCPECQYDNPLDALFCTECGFDLFATKSDCPSCGTTNPPQAKFCMNCGEER